MSDLLTVRIATAHVTAEPVRLVCRGLGSCVGVALWDPGTRIAGMSHILLPREDFSIRRENPHKFGDRSVETMVAAMVALGANPRSIVAKLAGGAKMFVSQAGETGRMAGIFRMGERNVESVRAALEKLGIRIVGEDTGGSIGRTMEFETGSGKVTITAVDQQPKAL